MFSSNREKKKSKQLESHISQISIIWPPPQVSYGEVFSSEAGITKKNIQSPAGYYWSKSSLGSVIKQNASASSTPSNKSCNCLHSPICISWFNSNFEEATAENSLLWSPSIMKYLLTPAVSKHEVLLSHTVMNEGTHTWSNKKGIKKSAAGLSVTSSFYKYVNIFVHP